MNAEFLKLRRTLVWPGVLLGPLGAVALNFAGYASRPPESWAAFLLNGEMIWALLIMPLLVSLLTAQLAGVEHAGGRWRLLLTLPVPRATIFARKVLVTTLLTLLAHLLFGLLLAASASLLPHDVEGTWSTGTVLQDAVRMWAGSFALTAIPLVLALHLPSFLAPTGVGVMATVAGALMASSEYGRWWPWVLSAYAVSPPTVQGASLTIGAVLAYSGVVAAATLLLGALSFARRDH